MRTSKSNNRHLVGALKGPRRSINFTTNSQASIASGDSPSYDGSTLQPPSKYFAKRESLARESYEETKIKQRIVKGQAMGTSEYN